MIPIEGQPFLTAAAMRAAEAAAAPTPEAMYALMERAGAGIADAVARVAGGREVLVLCGPGNNGGDGYVAARILHGRGLAVRVAAPMPPRTALARRAAAGWAGPVAVCTAAERGRTDPPAWTGGAPPPAPVLVDAMFGTGGREDHGQAPWLPAVRPLFTGADYRVAVDLPLGWTAAGVEASALDLPPADLTLAIGAVKPVHLLPCGRAACGAVRLIELGLDLSAAPVRVMAPPRLRAPDAAAHKYSRGMVGVVAGAMPGAAILAATGAARAGSGYVALFGDASGGPAALVRRAIDDETLSDRRLGAVVIGPGLGRDATARALLERIVRTTSCRLVLDGDALHLFDPAWLSGRGAAVVLTPHAGEHRALAERLGWPPVDAQDPFASRRAEVAALGLRRAVMVAKGAMTVVADAREAIVVPGGNPWLSTAGTGDVLAGAIAACVAPPLHDATTLVEAVAAGVWLHAEAARLCGASFVADDLAAALTPARAAL